jgi:hypothetical protein
MSLQGLSKKSSSPILRQSSETSAAPPLQPGSTSDASGAKPLQRTHSSPGLVRPDSSATIDQDAARLRRASSQSDLLSRVQDQAKLERPRPSQRQGLLQSQGGGASTGQSSGPTPAPLPSPAPQLTSPVQVGSSTAVQPSESAERLRLATLVAEKIINPSLNGPQRGTSGKTLQGTPHVRHLQADHAEISAFLRQGWGVTRAMNDTDQKHILKGEDIARKGGGTNIAAHVTCQNLKKSALIPASSEIIHTFSNGATGHVLILTPKYYEDKGLIGTGKPGAISNEEFRKLKSQFIPHQQVMEALQGPKSSATEKDVENSRNAREVMFNTQGKPLSLQHVVHLDNGLPQPPLSARDPRYDERRTERTERAEERLKSNQDAHLKTIAGRLKSEGYKQADHEKILAVAENELRPGFGAMDLKRWVDQNKSRIPGIVIPTSSSSSPPPGSDTKM